MSPQAGWILQEEIVPRLRSAIPKNVNQVGSEGIVGQSTLLLPPSIQPVHNISLLGTAQNAFRFS
jgi:hypothetical protein